MMKSAFKTKKTLNGGRRKVKRTNRRKNLRKRRGSKRRGSKRRGSKRRGSKRILKGQEYKDLTVTQKQNIIENREVTKRLAINYMKKVISSITQMSIDNNNNYVDVIFDENKKFYRTFLIRAEKFYKIVEKETFKSINYKIHKKFYNDMYKQFINSEVRPLIEHTELYKEFEQKVNSKNLENMFIVI